MDGAGNNHPEWGNPDPKDTYHTYFVLCVDVTF